MNNSPITILIGALGGEGGGVLAQWLVEAATRAGHPAQATSIPGVAQRTGATTYYVEVFPQPLAALGGRVPVLSLLPVPGCIDLALASEMLEAGRIVASGMTSAERTLLVASTSRTLTTAEKMALGDGRFPQARLLAVARAHSRRLVAFDLDAAARETGTLVSAVMLGAVAGSGVLPFGRDVFEAAIAGNERGAAASLAGFARGFAAVRAALDGAEVAVAARAAAATLAPSAADSPPAAAATLRPAAAMSMSPEAPNALAANASADPRLAAFASGARPWIELGCARLADYQDAAYVDLYLARLARVQAAERAGDPLQGHAGTLTGETARYLALWMAFDDVIRVADLKTRASRFARVRRETSAGGTDIVRVYDHFKPGVPELADLLPAWLARRALAWDRARQARGSPPWALALRVRADSVSGFLALRVLSSWRGARRRGLRYAREQQAIERWLATVERHAAADWDAGFELALCGRLVKGYGATNERGQRNLAHLVTHLAAGPAGDAATAGAIRAAREAALADEGGVAFDRALAMHGAPPRPVAAQPIRWVKRTAAPVPGAPIAGEIR